MKFSFKKNEEQDNLGAAVCSLDSDYTIPGLSELYFPEEPDQHHSRDIVDILSEMGKISEEQAERIRTDSARIGPATSSTAEAVILRMGIVSSEDILRAKAGLYDCEFKHITTQGVQKEAFEKLSVDFVRNNKVLPVAIEGQILVVATSEPGNLFVIEEVKKQTQMEVRLVVCRPEDIDAVCDSLTKTDVDYNVDDIISDMTEVEVVQEHEDEFQDLEKMAGQSPVIKFVNYLISNATRDGASDIHIEPKPKYSRIRYRIDGVLFETMQPPLQMHPAIVSRIKIMSNLDISERRLPQDGKISAVVGGRNVDLRVSVLPTNNGEKVVIRILENSSIMRGLDQLGMEEGAMEKFKEQVNLPHGIFLVTGPTGSGKSTTLYCALSQMDGNSLNISTVEDPVEYKLDFCNQVQISEKIGLTFAMALRSLLRQDPDIIMIGEIRDGETARIAVQAALTGHLVLSTLHTNDAPSTITRLVDIGVEPYLISASLNAIIAQRLVRKICPNCKEVYQVPDEVKNRFEAAGVDAGELYHGAGCDKCHKSGYSGRLGIYEMLIIDDIFRELITKDPSGSNMRRLFHEKKGVTLFDDGIVKVKKGLTTIEEVLRVTEVYGKEKSEIFVDAKS